MACGRLLLRSDMYLVVVELGILVGAILKAVIVVKLASESDREFEYIPT